MELTVRTTSMTVQIISVQMEEPAWMESIPTTVSALLSGLVSTVQKMWTSAGFSRILARTEVPAATCWAATFVCVSMVGVEWTALKTSMIVHLLHAAQAPHASTVLHLLSVSAPSERQVCSAIEMTPVSVNLVERDLSVTPTPLVACSTVTAHLDM